MCKESPGRWVVFDGGQLPHVPMGQDNHTAELTLNLLRGFRINPKLSAWEQLHGRYDFNAHPKAPPGIRVPALAKREVHSPPTPQTIT
jgi:hypothetical protein